MQRHVASWLVDMQWERNFREQMKRRRMGLGDSQSAFAKRVAARGLAFHQPTVQRIENGERPVRLDEAHVIAEVLGVTVDMMTQSADDERVDASIAKGRLDRFVRSIWDSAEPAWDDTDELADFVEHLSNAFYGAGGVNSPTTAWLAAWAVHGMNVIEAGRALEKAARRFHPDWEPEWEEKGLYGSEYPRDGLRDIVEDARWSAAPEALRPSNLAQLPVDELDDAYLLGTGPFAPDADGHG